MPDPWQRQRSSVLPETMPASAAASIQTGTEENPTYVIMQNQKGKNPGKFQLKCVFDEVPRHRGPLGFNRELKKLRRQLQGKRLIKIELCVKFSLLRLFQVDHVVKNRRNALSLAWYEWFSCKDKEEKIYCSKLPLSTEPQIWKFPVVVWQTTWKHRTKKRAARAAWLFFFIQPIKSLICGVVVDVAVVRS